MIVIHPLTGVQRTHDNQAEISGSGIQLAADCPGAHALCATLPNTPTDASRAGDRMHRAMWCDDTATRLSAEEAELTDRARRTLIYEVYEGILGGTEWAHAVDQLHIEIPLVAQLNEGLQVACQVDWLAILRYESRAIALDWKFGRVPVPHPAANYQMMTAALAVHDTFSSDTVETPIIQPLDYPSYHSADYPGDSPWSTYRDILTQILLAARAPDAPRTPSRRACQHCRAKRRCPEWADWADTNIARVNLDAPTIQIAETTDAELADIKARLDTIDIASAAKFLKSIDTEIKARNGAQSETNAYIIEEKPGSRKPITDIGAAGTVAFTITEDPSFERSIISPITKRAVSFTDLCKALRKPWKAQNPTQEDGKPTTNANADAAIEELLGDALQRQNPTKTIIMEASVGEANRNLSAPPATLAYNTDTEAEHG